jgi:hypothetical protein
LAGQQQAREGFVQIFETFLSEEHQQGFRVLFGPATVDATQASSL